MRKRTVASRITYPCVPPEKRLVRTVYPRVTNCLQTRRFWQIAADNPGMGDLIHLSERLADRSRPSAELARFFFALDDPMSYLAAERVERALGPIDWVPVLGPLSEHGGT